MGCEAASLLMALKTTGNALDMPYTQFLNELPKTLGRLIKKTIMESRSTVTS
jgi:hypothetical protein